MESDFRYAWFTCGLGREAHPCVSAQAAIRTTMCHNIDSWNDFQGRSVGTKTSAQKVPGDDVVLTGGGVRREKASARLLRKASCRGSSSISNRRRGSALAITLGSVLKS